MLLHGFLAAVRLCTCICAGIIQVNSNCPCVIRLLLGIKMIKPYDMFTKAIIYIKLREMSLSIGFRGEVGLGVGGGWVGGGA